MSKTDSPGGSVMPEGGPPRNRVMPAGVLAALVLLMTIVLGGMAGLALDRTVLGAGAGTPRDHVPFWALSNADRHRRWVEVSRSLKLTPAQNAAIDSVLAQQSRQLEAARHEIEPHIHEIMNVTRARIDSVLTPDQRARLEKEYRDRRARRHQHDKTPSEGSR